MVQALPEISGDVVDPPAAREALITPPAVMGEPPQMDTEGGFPVRAVTGSVVGVMLALLLSLLAMLLYRRKRMHARRERNAMVCAHQLLCCVCAECFATMKGCVKNASTCF